MRTESVGLKCGECLRQSSPCDYDRNISPSTFPCHYFVYVLVVSLNTPHHHLCIGSSQFEVAGFRLKDLVMFDRHPGPHVTSSAVCRASYLHFRSCKALCACAECIFNHNLCDCVVI